MSEIDVNHSCTNHKSTEIVHGYICVGTEHPLIQEEEEEFFHAILSYIS